MSFLYIERIVIDREEAEGLAAKINISGSGLYMLSKETLTKALGPTKKTATSSLWRSRL